MMRAYDKLYLSKAQNTLGTMLDFAVYGLHIELAVFYEQFLQSEISVRFQNGDCLVLVGKSGIELALEITGKTEAVTYKPTLEKSPEYWTGWATAYFQWYTNLSFRRIQNAIPLTEIRAMYTPYHEMDIMHFCDKMMELYTERNPTAALKMFRKAAGLSQSELAKATGIPLKTIQMYEQKQKNINAAKAETVLTLAKALTCNAEELLEIEREE